MTNIYDTLSNFSVEDLAEKMKIRGILLAPGVWKNTLYTASAIKELFNKFKDAILRMPITVEHDTTEKYLGRNVGKHTAIEYKDGAIFYEAEIDDPEACEDIKKGQFKGTSIRSWINIEDQEGKLVATDIKPIHNTLTCKPACKTCLIKSFTPLSAGSDVYMYYGAFPTSVSEVDNSCSCCKKASSQCEAPPVEVIKAEEKPVEDPSPLIKMEEKNEVSNEMSKETKETPVSQGQGTPTEPPSTGTTATSATPPAVEPVKEPAKVEIPKTPLDTPKGPEPIPETITKDVKINIILDVQKPEQPVVKETPPATSTPITPVTPPPETKTETPKEPDKTKETPPVEETPPRPLEEVVREITKAENILDIASELLVMREKDKAGRWQ